MKPNQLVFRLPDQQRSILDRIDLSGIRDREQRAIKINKVSLRPISIRTPSELDNQGDIFLNVNFVEGRLLATILGGQLADPNSCQAHSKWITYEGYSSQEGTTALLQAELVSEIAISNRPILILGAERVFSVEMDGVFESPTQTIQDYEIRLGTDTLDFRGNQRLVLYLSDHDTENVLFAKSRRDPSQLRANLILQFEPNFNNNGPHLLVIPLLGPSQSRMIRPPNLFLDHESVDCDPRENAQPRLSYDDHASDPTGRNQGLYIERDMTSGFEEAYEQVKINQRQGQAMGSPLTTLARRRFEGDRHSKGKPYDVYSDERRQGTVNLLDSDLRGEEHTQSIPLRAGQTQWSFIILTKDHKVHPFTLFIRKK